MLLHITNDYSGSTVYKNLVGELDELGLSQIVYNPIREGARIGKNEIELNTINSRILYSHILNKTTDRIFYRKKIRKIVKDIEDKIDFSKIKLIHAHTWYSDGGVAYLLAMKYNLPYVITIRNSDLNVFQKYLIHERNFGCKILENAKKVIIISTIYKERVLNFKSLVRIKEQLAAKMAIIPNGVDKFWIENAYLKNLNNKKLFNLLFIGKFTSGKNVLPLMKAIEEINNVEKRIHLYLVGGDGDCHSKVLNEINRNSNYFTYHGKIFDLNKLRQCFQESDIFVMPSKHETFGLVYVEALLQGLPILYTKNEGIDGLYDEKIGEKVSSSDAEEIKMKLLLMLNNYDKYEIPIEKLIENHNWKNIALKYKKKYESI